MRAREAYEMSLALINERDVEGDYHSDTADFEKNAHLIINMIIPRLWHNDCLVRGISPKNYRYAFEPLESLDEEIPLHVSVCSLVPFLLASLLIREEDEKRAEFFRYMFESAESRLLSGFSSAEHKSVVDVYS